MNPLRKFKSWYKAAKKDYPFDHTAFNLSTSYNNRPYSRMVLLKKILPDGFIFFTNLTSNKGKHFKSNNTLSMCFYWENLKKQIRIIGKGEVCKEKESDQYFSTRVRGSQIGAWASKQSNEIKSRSYLLDKFEEYSKKFENKPVPRPKYWVGIKIIPTEYEFWEGGEFRMHKREVYFLNKKNWQKKILSP
jgi:pyridoxamine 5'-phosphate oxidase|tara:strand:+ start:30 stop:599 length:570 start_codon:yes stop_codon:yes gene_type:complete